MICLLDTVQSPGFLTTASNGCELSGAAGHSSLVVACRRFLVDRASPLLRIHHAPIDAALDPPNEEFDETPLSAG